jgi:prevent-host-death family protein
MFNLKNIHSLTDFKRNANSYIESIRSTKSPIVLTVNGEAAVVVQDAIVFQDLVDRLKSAEDELNQLETDRLKTAIELSRKDFEQGRFETYTVETLDDLFEKIMTEGREEMGLNE